MKNIIINNPPYELVELFSLKEWRQRIHLYDDIYTPGTRCEYEWDLCKMPDKLSNQTFIDVGSNDGMMSFLAEQKGAKEVTSVDLYINDDATNLDMTNGWSINRIQKVKSFKKSTISILPCSIYNLATLNKKYDIVYCGNVIAWLDNPIEALKQLGSLTNKTLIIREDISKIKGKPVLEYINNETFTSCMFNGNRSFYISVLKSLGFKNIEIVPVDEYEIVERRANDFEKFTICDKAKIFINPFTPEIEGMNTNSKISTASVKINNKYFFNMIGWVDESDVKPYYGQMIPNNPVKRLIFEKKYRKTLLDNSMIFATR